MFWVIVIAFSPSSQEPILPQNFAAASTLLANSPTSLNSAAAFPSSSAAEQYNNTEESNNRNRNNSNNNYNYNYANPNPNEDELEGGLKYRLSFERKEVEASAGGGTSGGKGSPNQDIWRLLPKDVKEQLSPIDYDIYQTIEALKQNIRNNKDEVSQKVSLLIFKLYQHNRREGIYTKRDMVLSLKQLEILFRERVAFDPNINKVFFYYYGELGAMTELKEIVDYINDRKFALTPYWYVIWMRAAVREGGYSISISIYIYDLSIHPSIYCFELYEMTMYIISISLYIYNIR